MQFPMARAVELAPGGVIRQVYPLAGNEPIIGHDLLKDRERNLEAYAALTTRQLTLAGPFELLQGGVGVVGRFPIFQSDRTGRSSFWGFSIVLIRVPELLAAAGMTDFEREGYRYELCRIPPNGRACVVFARNGEGALDEAVSVPINTLNARWMLSVSPTAGWGAGKTAAILAAAAVVLALLLGGLQYFFLRRLEYLVSANTAVENA
jgi:sensor domain CHASE-containing protein